MTLFRLTLALALTVPASVPLAAQGGGGGGGGNGLPDKFENLKVLPKDIAQRALVDTMRSFALGLGVRCTYCHVGEEGKPFSTYDFKSDTLRTKRTARVMFQMVQDLNSKYLTQVPGRPEPPVIVRCETCHHGQARPRSLQDVLGETLARAGVDSAIQKYRDLRTQYYGSFTYDFRENVLNGFASRLTAQAQGDAALRVLQLNGEFFPASAQVHALMADAYVQKGDKPTAIEHLRKAIEMAPDNPQLKRRLDDLNRQ